MTEESKGRMLTNLKYYHRCISLEIREDSKALLVDLKNEWSDEIFELYAKMLEVFLSKINPSDYTLIIRCTQFKVGVGRLRSMLRPFLEAYRDAGFRFVKVITENPQKEFRRMIKQENQKIGFSMEFVNGIHMKQQVYL